MILYFTYRDKTIEINDEIVNVLGRRLSGLTMLQVQELLKNITKGKTDDLNEIDFVICRNIVNKKKISNNAKDDKSDKSDRDDEQQQKSIYEEKSRTVSVDTYLTTDTINNSRENDYASTALR